uniref:Peptidase_S8 domain-containing protein n=1 Tax=Macrostomum lignano TaxID=282301 RepID=A0A1I8FN61_9PLAT
RPAVKEPDHQHRQATDQENELLLWSIALQPTVYATMAPRPELAEKLASRAGWPGGGVAGSGNRGGGLVQARRSCWSRRPRSSAGTRAMRVPVFSVAPVVGLRLWREGRARTPSEFDVNVTGVWQEGNLGEGVTVCLLDDGLDYSNPDLTDAYNAKGSYDFNENDYDPMPQHQLSGARGCGQGEQFLLRPGVAPGARVSMLKILDGTVIDSMEAMAYNYQHTATYIYSSSWGPPDSGNFIDGPHVLGRVFVWEQRELPASELPAEFFPAEVLPQALRKGVARRSPWIRLHIRSCQRQRRLLRPTTATSTATPPPSSPCDHRRAVTQQGVMPPYAEECCACMHGVTVSSGGGRWIVTHRLAPAGWHRLHPPATRWHQRRRAARRRHDRLMLSARPCLSWRDVQHILVLTAEKVDKQIGHYTRNGAGLFHSHKHGFGMLTAWRMVQAAKTWSRAQRVHHSRRACWSFRQAHEPDRSTCYYDNSASASDSSPRFLAARKGGVNIQAPTA